MVSNLAKIGLAAVLGSGAAAAAPAADRAPGGEAKAAPAGSAVPRTMRPLGWRGVERVVILCQVTSESFVGSDIATGTLCERVRAAASKGAPVPVEIVGFSDPALQAPRTAILFIQGAIADVTPSQRVLLLAARTEQTAATEEARTYFGAAPRAAPFTSATDGAAWDAAIAASLSEVLPWLRPADKGDLLPEQ